jgi:hypothetical protein
MYDRLWFYLVFKGIAMTAHDGGALIKYAVVIDRGVDLEDLNPCLCDMVIQVVNSALVENPLRISGGRTH